MNPDSPRAPSDKKPRALLPNLGAEEGRDWSAITHHAPVLVAARLYSMLFAAQDALRFPQQNAPDANLRCETLWPESLGEAPQTAAFPWIAEGGAHAWLNTESAAAYAEEAVAAPLVGVSPSLISLFSDKGRTAREAADLGIVPTALMPLVEAVSSAECLAPDALIQRLDAALSAWPPWTERRFTLKPRWGTSGRGRVAGAGTVDTAAVRSALPRLAERGGGVLEPWLTRETDLSVSLHVPPREASDAFPTILGSLEMLTSPSGLYRGHCGEIDHRGRVFSGNREDETLRGDAAMLAGALRDQGFFGPCGIDAFTYTEGDAEGERSRLRSVVEFNPRITMGIVVLGLIRRALPQLRAQLDLFPGSRRGVLITTLDAKDQAQRDALLAKLGEGIIALDLASPLRPTPEFNPDLEAAADDASPMLFFGPNLESLRDAYRETTGC